MSQRIYLVGTDTEIGKTTLLQEILGNAQKESLRIAPFKPAQSGNQSFEESDCGRLMKSAGVDPGLVDLVAPNRYQEEKAPGSITSLENFTGQPAAIDTQPLQRCRDAMRELEHRLQSQWTFCEGAGGLWVPMPGGTWQPTWIKALSQACIVVAPVSLGTINHTILTVDAIQRMGHPILGIAWTSAKKAEASLAQENMAIVQAQTNLPALARPNEQGGLSLIPDFFRVLQDGCLELASGPNITTSQYKNSKRSH